MRPSEIDADRQAKPAKPPLPDVARDTVAHWPATLEKVGMAGIEAPIRIRDVFGRSFLIPASVDAFVSLDDPHVKGIHMSRLFLAVQEGLASEDFSFRLLEKLLARFVESQVETSKSAHLRLAFDFMVERRALLSEHAGWRKYPVVVEASSLAGALSFTLHVRIDYSSTCPCSAALARQLIQESFRRQFDGAESVDVEELYRWLGSEDAICATPHSQRSQADVRVRFAAASEAPTLVGLLDALENAVGTPVQTAVKREDEQEFARLNADNLMFAEDAARRFKRTLDELPGVSDWRVRVDHFESLHPHDAVAVAVKGVPGGFQP